MHALNAPLCKVGLISKYCLHPSFLGPFNYWSSSLIFDYNAAIISNSYLNFFATCPLLIFAKVWLLFDALSWYVNVDNVPWYHTSVPQVLSVIILITSMELPCSYLALWTQLQAAQANLNTQHNFITNSIL